MLQLDESVRYRSGVLTGLYGSDNNTDWFQVRGFDAAQCLDGSRLFGTGYHVWTPEPFGLEKAWNCSKARPPSSTARRLPGGVINAISKRPTATPQGLVNLQLATGRICVRSGSTSPTI